MTGCTISNNPVVTPIANFFQHNNIPKVDTIGEATMATAYELSTIYNATQDKTLILTSMVDVDNIEQTSNFGRIFSDSMMTELQRSGWDIVDMRGNGIVNVGENGEYYINRKELTAYSADSYVLVGTYGEYKEGLLINLRLLNMLNNKVVSASNVQLVGQDIVELAQMDNCQSLQCQEKEESNYTMQIIEDDCTVAENCKD
jgi:TolB-like protein